MTDDSTRRQAKAQLRRTLRAARREAAAAADPGRAQAVSAAVLGHPLVAAAIERARATPGPHPVAAYVSTPGEPPTAALRQSLAAAGLDVWLPVAVADRQLLWVPDPGPAVAAAWGLPRQPLQPDQAVPPAQPPTHFRIILVPALAATGEGRRLGQGGGYYDAWLSALPRYQDGGPLRVALVGPDELLDDVPVEPHDQPVDAVVVA